MKPELYCAWSRHTARGTPQGRIHAVDPKTGRAACGRAHAGIFSPRLRFGGRDIPDTTARWGRPFDCGDCRRITGV